MRVKTLCRTLDLPRPEWARAGIYVSAETGKTYFTWQVNGVKYRHGFSTTPAEMDEEELGGLKVKVALSKAC